MKSNKEIAAIIEDNKEEIFALIKEKTVINSLFMTYIGYDADIDAIRVWEADSMNIHLTNDTQIKVVGQFSAEIPDFSAKDIEAFILEPFEDEWPDYSDIKKDLLQKGAEDLAQYLTDEQAPDNHGIRQAMDEEWKEVHYDQIINDFIEGLIDELKGS